MIPIEDLANVALTMKYTDEDEAEEEDEGWSAVAVMCKSNLQPLLEVGKRNGVRRISGWIFRSFLGSFPYYRSRRWQRRWTRWRQTRLVCYGVSVLTFNHSWKKGRGMGQGRSVVEFFGSCLGSFPFYRSRRSRSSLSTGPEDEEEDEGGSCWFDMATMCKPSTSLRRREKVGRGGSVVKF